MAPSVVVAGRAVVVVVPLSSDLEGDDDAALSSSVLADSVVLRGESSLELLLPSSWRLHFDGDIVARSVWGTVESGEGPSTSRTCA